MLEVIDAKIRWNNDWGNPPVVYLLLDADYRTPDDAVWHPFVVGTPPNHAGTFFITRDEPAVAFLFEDRRPSPDSTARPQDHGALGRTVTLPDGTEYKTYGGWSSSDGAVNRLRLKQPAVAELLPHEIVECVIMVGAWDHTGFAGVGFDLPFVQAQLDKYAAGVLLHPSAQPADLQGSAEQSFIVHAGLPQRPESTGGRWIAWPADSYGVKPDKESECFRLTSQELAYTRARFERPSVTAQ